MSSKKLLSVPNRKPDMTIITDWQRSKLNQKQYCLQNKIAYHVFHYLYKRYRTRQADESHSFTPVSIQPHNTGNVELHLPDGRRIVFYQPVSPDYLKALLA